MRVASGGQEGVAIRQAWSQSIVEYRSGLGVSVCFLVELKILLPTNCFSPFSFVALPLVLILLLDWDNVLKLYFRL
jgi:hypothetical protein